MKPSRKAFVRFQSEPSPLSWSSFDSFSCHSGACLLKSSRCFALYRPHDSSQSLFVQSYASFHEREVLPRLTSPWTLPRPPSSSLNPRVSFSICYVILPVKYNILIPLKSSNLTSFSSLIISLNLVHRSAPLLFRQSNAHFELFFDLIPQTGPQCSSRYINHDLIIINRIHRVHIIHIRSSAPW